MMRFEIDLIRSKFVRSSFGVCSGLFGRWFVERLVRLKHKVMFAVSAVQICLCVDLGVKLYPIRAHFGPCES